MENKGITITNNTTLGTLVTFFPDITQRLNDLHVDYCCHGNISIGEAIKEHRLSPDFLRELQDAYEVYRNRPDKSESVADMSTEDLIRLIIDTHHIPERQLWEEITPMLNKIMTVHYEHGKDLLLQLHRQFSLLRAELEEHFAEEECEVFPLMLQAETKLPKERKHLSKRVHELVSEHEGAGEVIHSIMALTNNFTPPEYACPTFKATYAKMHELIDDIFLHIAKENSVLFPRFEE